MEVNSPKNMYRVSWGGLAGENGNHPYGDMYVQAAHTWDEEAVSEFLRGKSSLFWVRMGYPLGKYMAAVILSRTEYVTVRSWQMFLRTCCASLPRTMVHWIIMQPWAYQTCLDTRECAWHLKCLVLASNKEWIPVHNLWHFFWLLSDNQVLSDTSFLLAAFSYPRVSSVLIPTLGIKF